MWKRVGPENQVFFRCLWNNRLLFLRRVIGPFVHKPTCTLSKLVNGQCATKHFQMVPRPCLQRALFVFGQLKIPRPKMFDEFGVMNQYDFVQVGITNVRNQTIDWTKHRIRSFDIIHTNVKDAFVEFKLVVHHGNGNRVKGMTTIVATQRWCRRPLRKEDLFAFWWNSRFHK